MTALRRRVILALGSNLGDRFSHLQQATDMLLADAGAVRPVWVSPVYESAAVGGPIQPDYLSALLVVDTAIGPFELLSQCQDVERRLGRVRAERWGPRTIDVDIITYGEVTSDDPRLTLPHARAQFREFILVPWLEFDRTARLPGGPAVRDLLAGLQTGSLTRRPQTLSIEVTPPRELARDAAERRDRLHALESSWDRITLAFLDRLGLPSRARCLEVGGGAGSVARWLYTRFGNVELVDTDTTLLGPSATGFAVTRGDIDRVELGGPYDLVHCRLLLDLMPDPDQTVRRLFSALSDRGMLVLEELDNAGFVAVVELGNPAIVLHDRVVEAQRRVWDHLGWDLYMGRKLAGNARTLPACLIEQSGTSVLRCGGSPAVVPWRSALESLRDLFVNVGGLSSSEMEEYLELLADPTFVYLSPTLMQVALSPGR